MNLDAPEIPGPDDPPPSGDRVADPRHRVGAGDSDDLSAWLDAIGVLLSDLGVPGICASAKDLGHLEKLYDAGAPLDVVLRGIELGYERRIARGRPVDRIADLLPTIRAEIRRLGVVAEESL